MRNRFALLPSAVLAMVAVTLGTPHARAELFRPGDAIPQVIGDVFTWSQGDPHSTFSGWNNFNLGGGDPTELPSFYNPDVEPVVGTPHELRLNSPGSFIPGSGNLYSASVAQDFTATVNSGTSGGDFTRIVAQFRTLGTQLDYDSILLRGESGSIAPTLLVETGRSSLGGFGGTQLDHLAVWDLGESRDAYHLDFVAAGPHLSLGQFSIDTLTSGSAFPNVTAVPEPATWAGLSALAIVGIAWRRWKSARGMRQVAA